MRSIFAEESATYEDKEQVRKRRVGRQGLMLDKFVEVCYNVIE